ncbi:site-specific integrase [Polaromonas sp.]|uniref:tyrosine-type recombinase/integrase n=1 Tax=Polaromonas sp. TaxID=1869339 RepID=UPI00178E7ECC|nr:site-specific integrase [Polaromonas sp.]NMM04765.1 integrase arm-type DNA-binding domain-containing protein [Polaromonas sp.]
MARKAKDLTALEVNRLTAPGHHAVGGVSGLYLYVNDSGARAWVLRTMVGNKRRHMGLGGFPDVTLAQAREKARKAKDEIAQGIDPIVQRKAATSQLQAQQATEKTFRQASEGYIAAHGDTWRNPKHRAQWAATLETYAFPVMGNLLVKDVAQEHVLSALEPIWKTKNETASRLRGRIESVLDWATVRKYRSGENSARWKGHLDMLLPAPSKVKKVEHHRALPIDSMNAFMVDLRKREGTAARALEFTILTASRSGEVRGASWEEVDLKAGVWTVPSERMKSGKEHRVPLTESAIQILRTRPHQDEIGLVFPALRGGQLSDMAMTAVMRRMEVDAVPHGFRSTFRDWARERTNYPRDLAEQALAHALDNKVEAAYRRGDALEKRREMMATWADFCGNRTENTSHAASIAAGNQSNRLLLAKGS